MLRNPERKLIVLWYTGVIKIKKPVRFGRISADTDQIGMKFGFNRGSYNERKITIHQLPYTRSIVCNTHLSRNV